MDPVLRVLAAALALVPGGLAVLAAVRKITEFRRRHAGLRPHPRGGGGRGWAGGVREPRRPLPPHGAGAAALPIPDDAEPTWIYSAGLRNPAVFELQRIPG